MTLIFECGVCKHSDKIEIGDSSGNYSEEDIKKLITFLENHGACGFYYNKEEASTDENFKSRIKIKLNNRNNEN